MNLFAEKIKWSSIFTKTPHPVKKKNNATICEDKSLWQNSMNQKDKKMEVSQASQSQRSCRTGRERKQEGRVSKEIRKGKKESENLHLTSQTGTEQKSMTGVPAD